MEYKRFSLIRNEVRTSYDQIEDWMAQVFGERREDAYAAMEDEDLEQELAERRRGMRYFAAGRVKDRRMFASMLFPAFRGDPNEEAYREAVYDILRVAGVSVAPRTRHKLSFELGVLYFTADARGHLLGVVASEDFPMAEAFKFLEEMLLVYDDIDIPTALNTADEALWQEQRFRDDAFGIRDLAISAWKKLSRPDDGRAYDSILDFSDGGGAQADPWLSRRS